MTAQTPTAPRTEAGRALVEWATNAAPGQIDIWREYAALIEAEERRLTAEAIRDGLWFLNPTQQAKADDLFARLTESSESP